jgi:hypothetical protein
MVKHKKAQPEFTDWARLWFVAEWIPPPIASFQMTGFTSFLSRKYLKSTKPSLLGGT